MLLLLAAAAWAQAPTGEISGAVYDPSGSLVPNAAIIIRHSATGVSRTGATNGSGRYRFASLPAGVYQMQAGAAGFRTASLKADVSTGGVTAVDIRLEVGEQKETVNVDDVTPQVERERHTIDTVVGREQIQELPLNGRSFLQLAFLAPGVTVSAGNQGLYNRAMDVAILGNTPNRTRITVDGVPINDAVDGGTQQNFSQEVVEEFQLSSMNFDLSTGVTGSGALNIVTRTGTNRFHGSGFFFFRDHNLSAYPGLQRDPLAPDPFFARRQSGLWVGGPVRRERLFFFAAYEHTNQRGVFTAVPSDPAFRELAGITASPLHGDLFNARLDYHAGARHNAFLRYSHDSNDSFAPREDNSLPSAWVGNTNFSDSGVASLISSLRPTMVNEFRYSMTYWRNRNTVPTEAQCPGCFGLGAPHVVVEGAGVIFGNQTNSPQSRLVRSHVFADNFTWQRGTHRIKAGGEWLHVKGTGTYTLSVPGSFTLFSPQEVTQLAPQLAGTLLAGYHSLADVMSLPLQSFAFGIGDVNQPPAFQRGNADHDSILHIYAQDSWTLHPRFVVNFGPAWTFEANALNHDLTKPRILAPVFGEAGLGPEKHAWLHFTPALGFAWSLPGTRTVIRGGGGIYYDTIDLESRLVERAYLGPLGTGFLPLPGSVVPNPLPVPGVPSGTPLEFHVPTAFSAAIAYALLPLFRAVATDQLHVNANNTDLSVRNVDVFKTATDLFMRDFVPSSAQHLGIGVERQVTRDFAVTADFAFRHVLHEMLRGVDLNHFRAVGGPVIPACSSANATTPGVQCSNGPVQASISGGRSTYKALLVKADKRWSRGFRAQVAYALQDQQDVYGITQLDTPIANLNNWMQDVGPALPRHVLTASAVVALPRGLQVALLSSFTSRPPFQPIVTGADFYGTGIDEFLLPGGGANRFNFGLGRADMVRLVNDYNQQYGGKPGPNHPQTLPRITLPSKFDLGRSFHSQDVRVTKRFKLPEKTELQVFGEVFNLLNIANLRGYFDNLTAPSFGQPSARMSNAFGTGGPRAFQFGGRLTF